MYRNVVLAGLFKDVEAIKKHSYEIGYFNGEENEDMI
jgi:hypothetical protein